VTVFERLGRLVHRRRRWVIAAWAVILLVALPITPRVASALRAGGFTLDSLESARARSLLERELGLPPSALVIAYSSKAAPAGSPAFEAAAAGAAAAVAGAPHVTGVLSHLTAPGQVSADGTTAYDVVLLDLPPDQSPDALPGVRERLASLPSGPVQVALAGGPAFYGDIQAVSEADLRRSELVSLPLAALALLVVFGSVVAAGLPLAVGGGAVLVALAIIWVVAGVTQMSIFVLNLATLLGLGLGVDYSLLMTSRFREELHRRRPDRAADPAGADTPGAAATTAGERDATGDERVEAAIRVTVATAGRAVFFSGLTVLLGLTGLILFEFPILRSVGIAGAIVVGLAVGAALTLLPAILSVLGDRLDALRVRRVNEAEEADGPWARLARRVMRHPVAVFIPTLGFLLVLGAPFLHVRFNAPDATILPPEVASRAAFDLLDDKFGAGRFAPISLAIRTTGPATSPANVAALVDYSRRLAADPRIRQVDGLVDVDPRLTKGQYVLLYGSPTGPPDRFVAAALAATTKDDLTMFTLTTPYGPNADEARRLVGDLRATSGPLAAPAGMSVLVGGGAADVADVVGGIGAGFPRTALFIFVSTYLVLFVLLRSVVLPAKALIMNTLSIVAAFGALVWIFQDGNLSGLLGFQPLGYVETTQPVILFCVLFGLSMDYEVFLLSRMKEVWDRTGNNTEAVARGLERSGRIVTSAALIVVVVAGSFAFADIVLIKAIGLGVAISVALDATVVRALLVPATMRLLGDWNWWMPARLERWVAGRLPASEAETEAALR
jgi:putative drug exporter of the RND superfamily